MYNYRMRIFVNTAVQFAKILNTLSKFTAHLRSDCAVYQADAE